MGDQQVKLRDGRALWFAERGDPMGKPVLYFQGAPGSRIFRHPDETIALKVGARVITIDRPGLGRSDFQSGRTLLGWVDDVRQLVDMLHIERFALAGSSAGGPHVAACACKMPDRLTNVLICGCFGPVDLPGATDGMALQRRLGSMAARRAPWLLRLGIWLTSRNHRDSERFFKSYTAHNRSADQALLAQPEIKQIMIENYAEALRQGIRGFAQDVMICARPWGFRLEDIQKEMHLWHGDQDTSTPLAMAQQMAKLIPHCTLRVFPGEGHLLFFAHWREMLEFLVAA